MSTYYTPSIIRSLTLLLCTLTALSATAKSTSIKIDVVAGATLPTTTPTRLLLHLQGDGANKEALREEIEIGGTSTLEVPSGTWTVSHESPHYWVQPETVWLGDAGTNIKIVVWPKAFVEGSMSVPSGESLPKHFSLRFQRVENSEPQNPLTGTVACTAGESGKFRCGVPAGLLDLRLMAEGFITEYFWNSRVLINEGFGWGKVNLRPGASIVGYITTSGPHPLSKECWVKLFPLGLKDDQPSERESNRSKFVVPRAHVRPSGFFHMDGIAPGSYTLVAEQDPYAPARVPVNILARREAILRDPINLAPPATLDILTAPPVAPNGEPWQVRLLRGQAALGRVQEVGTKTMPYGGTLEWENLNKGIYQILIETDSGESWHHQEFAIEDEDPRILIEIKTVSVHGDVYVGDEPLSARVIFGDTSGAVNRTFISNEKGQFSGLLPHGGEWKVRVSSESPRVRRLVIVDATPPKGSDEADVSIQLPDCRISGEVVDDNGNAVANALVNIVPRDEVIDTGFGEATDDKGQFEFEGLPSGHLTLQAAGSQGESDLVGIDLNEEFEHPPITLQLRAIRIVDGIVRAGRSTVPGAAVSMIPASAPNSTIFPRRTGASGRSEHRLPENTQEVLFQVGAPGFAFRMGRATLPSSGPLALNVEQLGGTLVLEAGQAANPNTWEHEVPYIIHHGSYSPFFMLTQWAQIQGHQLEGGRIEVPMMETGNYAFCLVSPKALARFLTGWLPESKCAKGRLDPLGSLGLRLPSAQSPDAAVQ